MNKVTVRDSALEGGRGPLPESARDDWECCIFGVPFLIPDFLATKSVAVGHSRLQRLATKNVAFSHAAYS